MSDQRIAAPAAPPEPVHSMTEAERAIMRADVRRGLGRAQKELPPKYFYDERGSRLFDEITRLPEYYLTRAERALIASFAQPWLRRISPCTLVELGAGSGEKTRLLLDALPAGAVYVPVDISRAYLEQIAEELGRDYADLHVSPARADITRELELPADATRPLLVAFIGSTIGNFEAAAAASLLRQVAHVLLPGDHFMLGVDLRKERHVLEAAYNDERGITAAFNLNVLHVLNRELAADFDLDAFRHHAFYDERLGRVEMHLVSERPQRVHIPEVGTYTFDAGETIRTEISSKYDEETVREMLGAAGMSLEQWITDGRYALATAVASASAERVAS